MFEVTKYFTSYRPLSKEKRGRYGKGRVDAEPTVLVACVV